MLLTYKQSIIDDKQLSRTLTGYILKEKKFQFVYNNSNCHFSSSSILEK